MHDQCQGIDLVAIDQYVQFDQVGRLVAIKMIIQRSIAAAGGLETVEEVQDHFVHRHVVTHLHLAAEELHVALHATLLDAQGDDVTQVLLRHQNGRGDDRLAEVGH